MIIGHHSEEFDRLIDELFVDLDLRGCWGQIFCIIGDDVQRDIVSKIKR